MSPERLSRRKLLVSAGFAGATAAGLARPVSAAPSPAETVAFWGRHQAGIELAQQRHTLVAALDLTTSSARELQRILRAWSEAAARMAAGRAAAAGAAQAGDPPPDSGEALGLEPSRLTVTIGLGPGAFDLRGLRSRRPAGLAPLPAFRGERLQPARSGGDLCVQACADDPVVAFHAVRMLSNLARGTARLRWTRAGFLPAAYGEPQTPRNLMGLKDGTHNPRPGTAEFADTVWVRAGEAPAWLADGTFLVVRQIRMNLPRWDSSELDEQERTIGRRRVSGAPLTGAREHDPPDFAALDRDGRPVIPADAHVRLAHPEQNGGIRIFRRGYSFADGVAELGPLDDSRPGSRGRGFDAGLLFLAYMRDPRRQFVPVQARLAAHDHLNEYVTHVGSAVFAIPPGAREGGYLGETLFG